MRLLYCRHMFNLELTVCDSCLMHLCWFMLLIKKKKAESGDTMTFMSSDNDYHALSTSSSSIALTDATSTGTSTST